MMVDVMLVSGHLSLVSLFRTPLVKTLTGLTPVQFKKKKTISLSSLPLLFLHSGAWRSCFCSLRRGFHFCLFLSSNWVWRYPEEMLFKFAIEESILDAESWLLIYRGLRSVSDH